MSILKSIKTLFGGGDARINPNDLKKLSEEELEEMIETKRELLIKEYKLKNKGGEMGKGLVGMRNLGNTCFMSTALQCLSNTWSLTEYLFSTDWEEQINSVSTAAEGRLLCEYYLLLKKIWIENSRSVNPGDIKKAIVRVSRTFAGFSQQDSQEFLSYFLDAIHEDLNQVFVKPYIQQKDYTGECVTEFAAGAWKNHTMRNRSFIVDTFHGQYFSKIRCPDCKHESVTCDPFDMLSLNLPTREQMKFEGYFVSYSYDKDTYSLSFIVDDSASLDKILHKIAKDWNKSLAEEEPRLEVGNLVPYYCLRSRIVERIKGPYDQITAREIMQNDGIFFIFENYSRVYAPLVFKDDAGAVQQQLGSGDFRNRLRVQVFIRGKSIAVEKEVVVPASLSPYQLYLLIYLIYRKPFLNVQAKNSEWISLSTDEQAVEEEFARFFPDETIDPTSAIFILSVNLSKIFTISKTGSIFDKAQDGKAEVIVTLNESFFTTDPKLKSCKKLYIDNLITAGRGQSLYSCLDQFISEEKLDEENMWYCPKCNSHKEAFKRMAIIRYPKILIVHLKRFKKDIYKHHLIGFRKNTELVDFPIDNLELNKYVINPGDEKIRYSLYGVINHYGNCGGGHYIAMCKNRPTKTWHCYDDSDVSAMGENEIITDAAYVLFYELKKQ